MRQCANDNNDFLKITPTLDSGISNFFLVLSGELEAFSSVHYLRIQEVNRKQQLGPGLHN